MEELFFCVSECKKLDSFPASATFFFVKYSWSLSISYSKQATPSALVSHTQLSFMILSLPRALFIASSIQVFNLILQVFSWSLTQEDLMDQKLFPPKCQYSKGTKQVKHNEVEFRPTHPTVPENAKNVIAPPIFLRRSSKLMPDGLS